MSIYTKKFYLRLAFAILFFSMVQGKTFAGEGYELMDPFTQMSTPEKIKFCLQQFSSGIFFNESLHSYNKKLDSIRYISPFNSVAINKIPLLKGIGENILLFPLVLVKGGLLICTKCTDCITASKIPCIVSFKKNLQSFLTSSRESTKVQSNLPKWARGFGRFVRIGLVLLMVLFISYFAREWKEKEMDKNQVESAFSAADNRMISIKAIGTIWYYYTWPMRQSWMSCICILFVLSILHKF